MRMNNILPIIMGISVNKLLDFSCQLSFQTKIDVVAMLLLRLHREQVL